MQRFLTYKAPSPEVIVKWMGGITDGGMIQDENGEVIEKVTSTLEFQVLKVSDGWLGVLLVEAEEINIEEVENG